MADLDDVQNKISVHSFNNIKFNMYRYIFTATVITVYKHDKQKTIVYLSDQFKMEESKKKHKHFTVTADLNVVQKKSSVVTYLSFLLIIFSMSDL